MANPVPVLAIVPELITVRRPWPTDTALPPFCPEMMPPCRLVTVPPENNATTSPPNAAVWVMVPALVTIRSRDFRTSRW